MAKLVTFTEEEIGILREVISYARNLPLNEIDDSEIRLNQSTETYIGKAPTGGIPGLTDTTPGSAYCDIYKILPNDVVSKTPIYKKKVYNLSTSSVLSGTYFVTRKDKFGKWTVSCPCG